MRTAAGGFVRDIVDNSENNNNPLSYYSVIMMTIK